MVDAQEILDFWFGAPGSPEYGSARPLWFRGGPEMDRTIRERFLGCFELAEVAGLRHWRDAPRACLALVIVLDQFPRNMFRGTARSFAADAAARDAARCILDLGYDRMFLPVERMFAYLPFEHSEDLADQRLSVRLFTAIEDHPARQQSIDYAILHMEIIERFGRFPHRNDIVGRTSTPAEVEYLANGAERFGTAPSAAAPRPPDD
jgi:uncharacterized protein (DUF924 family)